MGRREKDPEQTVAATPFDSKRTIADFLAAAGAMDEAAWEAAWDEAVERVDGVSAGYPPVVAPGHYAAEGAAPAGESMSSSLMGLLLLDALAMAAANGGWSAPARKSWHHAVALVAQAWNGRMVVECVERFRFALGLFGQRGEVAIDLAQEPGEGTSVLWVRTGILELEEEATEQMAPWFLRHLRGEGVPCECRREEVDDALADGAVVLRRTSCRIRARVA